jgi:hypothetical protein
MKAKYYVTAFLLMLIQSASWACPVCEKQQPKLLRGITHGAGPESNWDWVIIGIIGVITVLTFIFSAKYLIFPAEKEENHIKNSILSTL